MSVRAFPATRQEPRKRVLLIPVVLIVSGVLLNFVPVLRFFGTILALTGVMSIFLVGMVFADLYAASRRSRDIIKARKARDAEFNGLARADRNELFVSDPFDESFGDEED